MVVKSLFVFFIMRIKEYILNHVLDIAKDITDKAEKLILGVIIINCIVIFLQETGITNVWINAIDAACTIIFVLEMVFKQRKGLKQYWTDGWNMIDGILVLISIPSLFSYVFPIYNTSWILALRLFRIFRFFRIVRLWGDVEQTFRNIKKAISQCFSVFVGFGVLLFVCALISCALFKDSAPQFFGTPIASLYSIFRMCTIEGWYEIPEVVVQGAPSWTKHFVHLYFISILITMGILGMSIINSIFVDAMVSDNNKGLEKEIKELKQMILNLQNNQKTNK